MRSLCYRILPNGISCLRPAGRLAVAAWALLAWVGGAGGQDFTDPAPPRVHPTPEGARSPEPAAREGLRYHAPPRPLAAGAVTHEWRAFLGPLHSPASTERPLLARFPPSGPRMVWEITKGEGYAAPAVVRDSVVLFHRVGDEEVVERLHAETGRRYWRFAYPTRYRDRYGYSGGPRCQPVSDGERIYTFGAEGKLHCLWLETGEVLWSRDLLKEFAIPPNFFGVGATPLLEEGRLIINLGAPGGPCVAAFDSLTGRLLWGAGKEWGPSYASPIPATMHGTRVILVFAGGESRPPTGGLMGVEAATGKVLFTFPWRGQRYESVNASSPVVLGSRVFLSECYGSGGVLVEIQPDWTVRTVWRSPGLGTHFMTAVVQGDYLYGIHGHGPRNAPLVCLDVRTGEEKWRHVPEWTEAIPSEGGERRAALTPGLASLLRVDGRVLMLSEYGHLVWLALEPGGYRELERARLFLAPESWTMPVLSRGLLYVCQNNRDSDGRPPRLLCYDLRGEEPAPSGAAAPPP